MRKRMANRQCPTPTCHICTVDRSDERRSHCPDIFFNWHFSCMLMCWLFYAFLQYILKTVKIYRFIPASEMVAINNLCKYGKHTVLKYKELVLRN